MDTPCDAMLLAAMTNLLMGESATSNLLMGTTRAPSRSRRTASTSTSQALDRSFSAFEYATECATSEASNTVFTAQTSFAVLQALQAATTAVQLREALLAAMPLPCELDIANALTRARQRLRESSSRRRRRPRPAQTQPARACERLGSLAVRAVAYR